MLQQIVTSHFHWGLRCSSTSPLGFGSQSFTERKQVCAETPRNEGVCVHVATRGSRRWASLQKRLPRHSWRYCLALPQKRTIELFTTKTPQWKTANALQADASQRTQEGVMQAEELNGFSCHEIKLRTVMADFAPVVGGASNGQLWTYGFTNSTTFVSSAQDTEEKIDPNALTTHLYAPSTAKPPNMCMNFVNGLWHHSSTPTRPVHGQALSHPDVNKVCVLTKICREYLCTVLPLCFSDR